ncbi:MAG: hypothetical protein ACRDT4_23065 [Micromonosporaceae bacterium]
MGHFATTEIRPTYVPERYQFRRRFDGAGAAGFRRDRGDQSTLVYTRGLEHSDATNPLVIHASPRARQELDGTEGQAGSQVEFGVDGVTAAYHDGMWEVDAAVAAELPDGETALTWRTGAAHSVTVWTSHHTVAVRAPASVSREQLVEVARSLPIVR